MGTVIIGGGPHPNAQIYSLSLVSPTGEAEPASYVIKDGDEMLAHCPKLSHALALLPLIQSGE